MVHDERPIVLITGAAGGVGSALAEAFGDEYTVIGMDQPDKQGDMPLIGVDLSKDESVRNAFEAFAREHGRQIASVIHLAAYFDFTGEEHPLYESVNVQGTRRLMQALRDFEVEQIVYAGTMLVHGPGEVGERIDEAQPLAPKWAYPQSKARAEEVIQSERGSTPVVLLHLAGLYDAKKGVPTLMNQIARIYSRDLQGHLYSGDLDAGQAFVHAEDMVDAFKRTVDRRASFSDVEVILVGEPETLGYGELQDALGKLLHGDEEWATLRVPKAIAAVGAAVQDKLEPVVPDAIDQGERPFIKPFMVGMADDHYALDISKARRLLGWEPRHRLSRGLPSLIKALKADPAKWFAANRIPAPAWLQDAVEEGTAPEPLRVRHEGLLREQHSRYRWAHFINVALGFWLMATPPALDLQSRPMLASDLVAGLGLVVFGALSLSWRFPWARWACAAIGTWVMTSPLVFWAPTAAGYLNGMLVGMMIVALAILTPPEPGVSPLAATEGPEVPEGWSYNPSGWTQRVLIIVLAFAGLLISRYMAAYQLGHVDSAWDPFFRGGPDPKNGTEEIITSSVSKAFPLPDAGLGALTYALEILTGLAGSRRRWRTMPWLVLLFGLMIVPLGVVSIFFIIIQPIWLGTWCTLCLLGAAAMVIQIPYSLDEIVATSQFLWRRKKAGRSLLRVLLFGDTDQGEVTAAAPEFSRPPGLIVRDIMGGGVTLPWTLAVSAAIGIWLMCTRLTLGNEGTMANVDHIIGALVVTVSVTACAKVAHGVRWANLPLGAVLLVAPFLIDALSSTQMMAALLAGAALIVLNLLPIAAPAPAGGSLPVTQAASGPRTKLPQ